MKQGKKGLFIAAFTTCAIFLYIKLVDKKSFKVVPYIALFALWMAKLNEGKSKILAISKACYCKTLQETAFRSCPSIPSRV